MRIKTTKLQILQGEMITAAVVAVVMGVLVSHGSCEYTTARMYQKHYQEYDHYQDPIPVTEPETDHYYHQTHPHRYRTPPSEKGLDFTSLGILAIIKLLLIKV
ncbi:hypothetical protein GE061_004051 [Apolygus lucorum]|uniref:Uncharacterized protein n=1 Tax=Apolygus lucorum TaxID=248454 RepID=A0A8S9WZV9_APOLU|nr:hypothetical protein GE061_004051 [Apolygus lucorum]